MAETAQLHAIVRGHVQGVGFRYFVVERAEALDLSGYVRNLMDGRAVEVVAEGARDSLESLLRDLQSGPRSARVTGLETHWGPYTGSFRGFEVKY